MELDFYREYLTYSNVALLQITLQPHQYQSAAVAAANELLTTRSVTEAEIQQAHDFITPKPLPPQPAPEQPWRPGDDLFKDSEDHPHFAAIQRHWWIITFGLALSIFYNIALQLRILSHGHSFNNILNIWSVLTSTLLMALQVLGLVFFGKGAGLAGSLRWPGFASSAFPTAHRWSPCFITNTPCLPHLPATVWKYWQI